MWGLATARARRPAHCRAPLPATTHPSFATLLTGASPARHRVRTTTRRHGTVPDWVGATTVRVPTLLDACLDAGRVAAAVMGDHELLRVLRAEAVPDHWPPDGSTDGIALDAHGYPTNDAVRPRLLEAAADPGLDLLFGHLNEADTVGHDHGPVSAVALDCHARTDALVASVVDALRPGWAATLLVIVSDHGMAPIQDGRRLDPCEDARLSRWIDDWLGDGGAALVRLRAGTGAQSAMRRAVELDGIESAAIAAPDQLLLTAARGHAFAGTPDGGRGGHGGPGTRRALAIVAGGHPATAALRDVVDAHPPAMEDWAPTLAGLLGVPLSDATGRDLLAGARRSDPQQAAQHRIAPRS